MPSITRRRLLAGTGFSAAGLLGGLFGLPRPSGSGGGDGDWPMSRYDPAGTSYNPDVVGPKSAITYAWRTETPWWLVKRRVPSAGQFRPHMLALIGDRLFVAGDGIAAFELETGQQLFATQGPYWSAPARASASIYRTDTLVVTGKDGVIGLNGGGGISVPFAGQVGAERWTVDTDDDENYAAPVTVEGTAYAPLPADNRLVAVDTEGGTVDWSQTISDPSLPQRDDLEQIAPAHHRPVVRDGTVFAANRYGIVSAYDAESGSQGWQRTISGPSSNSDFAPPVATEEGLFLLTDAERLLLDPDDGSVRWRHGHDRVSGVPAVADGVAFYPDHETILAVDLATGDSLWSRDRNVEGAVVVADGTVYSAGISDIFAFDAETGEKLFGYEVGIIESAPIVGDGRVYVATNSEIFALEGEQ